MPANRGTATSQIKNRNQFNHRKKTENYFKMKNLK